MRQTAVKRRFGVTARIAFWLTSITVGILLLLPGDELPTTTISDKLEHALAFMALTLLGFFAYPRKAAKLCLGLVTMGALFEGLQIFIPGRTASVLDAAANTMGVIAGIFLYATATHLLAAIKQSRPRPSGIGD